MLVLTQQLNSSTLTLCWISAADDPVQPCDPNHSLLRVCHSLFACVASAMSQLVQTWVAHGSFFPCDSGLYTEMQGWSPLRCAIAAWEGPTSVAATHKVGNSFKPHVSWHSFTSQSQVIQALSVQLLHVCMRGGEHMMGLHCLSHCASFARCGQLLSVCIFNASQKVQS